MFMMMMMIIFMISILLILLSNTLSKKIKINFEKMTPFESGFTPMNSIRMPFSLRFFLITIIFLIFDVEIALMIPMISLMKISNMFNWMLMSLLFMMILMIGLIYEWNEGALNWF